MTQDKYIAILFDDCGFSGPQRRDWLNSRYNTKYTDDLGKNIKSEIIDYLKEYKESLKTKKEEDEEL